MIENKAFKISNIANLDLDSNVKHKLSLNLSSIVSGRKDILITPLAREIGPDNLIDEFDKVFEIGRSKLNECLQTMEADNKAKYGPRSIAVPWTDRKQSLTASFDRGKHDKIEFTIGASGKRQLRPLSISSALKLLKNNTNSGLPYYTRKGIVKQRVLDKFDTLIKRRDPCILFTRTQELNKTRNVWGYPMADTLNEMRYYSPLLEYQKELPYRAALLSPIEVSRRLTALVRKAVASENILLSIDFAAYDTTVRSSLQKAAFDYIKSLFQARCESDIDYIADRFLNIGIVTPDGVLSGPHGVPTGSTFTNEVDSIVQAGISLNLPFIEEDRFQVQGDDGVYLLHKSLVDKLLSSFKTHGLIVNDEKISLSNEYAMYLQNLYHIDYLKDGIIGGIYPVYRALNRLVYQERWSDFEDYEIKGKDFYSIRSICILENCKYHPLFKELVQFVLKRDKYSLTYSDQGLARYVQMTKQTKGAGEILNHQYGDDVAGIKSFETYKLISELS